MGSLILEKVLELLQQADFRAELAYPGRRHPVLTGTVAAVHLESVDFEKRSATVEICVVCPASLGGTDCELEALRAARVLSEAGAVCRQQGCSYDSLAQVYQVSVLATFTEQEEAPEPGFGVYVNKVHHSRATSFCAIKRADHILCYESVETEPAGMIPGCVSWKLALEEIIPVDEAEPEHPEEEFSLSVTRGSRTETFTGCYWSSVKRVFAQDGLHISCEGLALAKEVE